MGLAGFFKRDRKSTKQSNGQDGRHLDEDSSISVAVPHSPLCYTVDIRRTKDHGAEVVVSLHNTSELPIFLKGATVHYWFDDADGGSHELFFPSMRQLRSIKMLQFEVQEGHFHLPNLDTVGQLHTRVEVDWKDEEGTRHHKISQRLDTANIHTHIKRSA